MSIFLSLDTWCENCKWKSFADHERFVQIKYRRGDNFDYKITTATVFGTIMKLIVAHIIPRSQRRCVISRLEWAEVTSRVRASIMDIVSWARVKYASGRMRASCPKLWPRNIISPRIAPHLASFPPRVPLAYARFELCGIPYKYRTILRRIRSSCSAPLSDIPLHI